MQDNGGTANGGVDLDQSANTFTVNVTPVNDAPTIDAIANRTVNEDAGRTDRSAVRHQLRPTNECAQTLTVTPARTTPRLSRTRP